MSAAQATRLSPRRKTNPFKDEQNTKNAVADADRYRQSRLTFEQKAEKVGIESERHSVESSQAATVRLLDNKRHRFATRSAKVADSVVVTARVSNKVLNVQL